MVDVRPATCPLRLPLHSSQTCCIIGIIMGSTAPPWTWQVKPSNKNTKASILVIANNLNICSNHSRDLLQLSCLSQTGEGKKGRVGERGSGFFPLKMRFLRLLPFFCALSTTFLIMRWGRACSERCSTFKTECCPRNHTGWKWRDLWFNQTKSLAFLTSSSLPIL